ncbi:MAG: hypothetical protein V3W18_08095 [candidate division Zixibacteria bacterium]
MSRYLLILLCWVSLFSRSFGQELEIFGYYEPQYSGLSLDNKYIQLISNKLRVDLSSVMSNNIEFAANVDLITYHGNTNWYIPDFLPRSIADSLRILPPGFLTVLYKDTLFLDNVYVKFPIGRFDITAGKQQISLGTGYVWNPTDLFNYKSLIEPAYEQPGHNAFRIDMTLISRYNVSFIFDAGETGERSTKFVRLKGGLGHFDFSGVFIETIYEPIDYRTYTYKSMYRRLYGGDFAGELLGLGIWGEGGYNDFTLHDNLWEIDFGVDYTLDNELYVLAEYYYNGFGKDNSDDYDLNDWMLLFTGEIKSISRENLYIYADYPLTDLIHLNNSIVFSISDNSAAFIPGFYYSFAENLDINLFMYINTGKPSTAYSDELGQSGLIRLRYYF